MTDLLHKKPPSAPLESISSPSSDTMSDVQNNSITDTSSVRSLADVERVAIEHAIAICNDNIVKAASLLEVSPSTLYRKVQQWQD
jgi:two-component system repressor protein LuxO